MKSTKLRTTVLAEVLFSFSQRRVAATQVLTRCWHLGGFLGECCQDVLFSRVIKVFPWWFASKNGVWTGVYNVPWELVHLLLFFSAGFHSSSMPRFSQVSRKREVEWCVGPTLAELTSFPCRRKSQGYIISTSNMSVDPGTWTSVLWVLNILDRGRTPQGFDTLGSFFPKIRA